jgi:hypothetical protein
VSLYISAGQRLNAGARLRPIAVVRRGDDHRPPTSLAPTIFAPVRLAPVTVARELTLRRMSSSLEELMEYKHAEPRARSRRSSRLIEPTVWIERVLLDLSGGYRVTRVERVVVLMRLVALGLAG